MEALTQMGLNVSRIDLQCWAAHHTADLDEKHPEVILQAENAVAARAPITIVKGAPQQRLVKRGLARLPGAQCTHRRLQL